MRRKSERKRQGKIDPQLPDQCHREAPNSMYCTRLGERWARVIADLYAIPQDISGNHPFHTRVLTHRGGAVRAGKCQISAISPKRNDCRIRPRLDRPLGLTWLSWGAEIC